MRLTKEQEEQVRRAVLADAEGVRALLLSPKLVEVLQCLNDAPRTSGQVADEMGLAQTYCATYLKKLVEKGYATRTRDTEAAKHTHLYTAVTR